jgi:hypothetical protein
VFPVSLAGLAAFRGAFVASVNEALDWVSRNEDTAGRARRATRPFLFLPQRFCQ